MNKKILFVMVLFLLEALSLAAVPVASHEEREISDYDVELGWRVEPVYTNIFNGPEVFVHDKDGAAVEGLEDTLQLAVEFGGKTKTLKLYPVYGDSGHYTADLIPTQPGDYSFHLTGKIGDADVDESFTSADGQFGTVEPITDIQFP